MGKPSLYSRKMFHSVILVTLAMVLFFSGPVFADTTGPAFSASPDNGTIINSGKITISVTAKDPDNVNASSVVMKIDGSVVETIRQYDWLDEYTDDLTTLFIYYPAALTEGNHDMYISAKDGSGMLSEYTWSFTVSAPPAISSLIPVNESTITEQKPVISAVASDNSGIDETSITMTVNGIIVETSYDPATGKVAYQPQSNLANEAIHNVVLELTDTSGNPARAEWSFKVVTYNEMPFSADDVTCQKCHLRTTHPMGNCAGCHGTNLNFANPVYPLDDCYKCHFGDTVYPAAYHLDGLPYSMQPDHPTITTDSCVECHSVNWTTVPEYHDITNTAERHLTTSTGCENCHSSSLTREHYRRIDSTGAVLTCFTCHSSPDNRVREAISAGNSSCQACHSTTTWHQHPVSATGYDPAPSVDCSKCHATAAGGTAELAAIHANAADRGKITGYSCATCHNSTFEGADKVITGDGSLDMMKNSTTVIYCTDCHNGTLTDALGTKYPAHGGSHSTMATGYGQYNWDSAVDCAQCHATLSISSNHIYTGSAADCNTCHSSSVAEVTGTIESNWSRAAVKTGYTCSTCHNSLAYGHSYEHNSTGDEPVTCSGCHDGTTVSGAFNVPAGTNTTVSDTGIHPACNKC
ncbi:MAG: hypothetical protein CVU89_17550, partial [Firmicutes bacterium HGW-Firmicutes-14]